MSFNARDPYAARAISRLVCPIIQLVAYTLDLKYNFCRSARRLISEEFNSWRKRALELEAELHAPRAAVTQADIGMGSLIFRFYRINRLERVLSKTALPFTCRRLCDRT